MWKLIVLNSEDEEDNPYYDILVKVTRSFKIII